MDFEELVAELAARHKDFASGFESEITLQGICDAVRLQLVEMRKAAGLRQEELAERLGMGQSAVSRLERGTGDIGLATIARYAAAIGVRPVIAFAPVDHAIGGRSEARQAVGAARRVSDRRLRLHRDDVGEHYSALAQRSVSDFAELAIEPDEVAEQDLA